MPCVRVYPLGPTRGPTRIAGGNVVPTIDTCSYMYLVVIRREGTSFPRGLGFPKTGSCQPLALLTAKQRGCSAFPRSRCAGDNAVPTALCTRTIGCATEQRKIDRYCNADVYLRRCEGNVGEILVRLFRGEKNCVSTSAFDAARRVSGEKRHERRGE